MMGSIRLSAYIIQGFLIGFITIRAMNTQHNYLHDSRQTSYKVSSGDYNFQFYEDNDQQRNDVADVASCETDCVYHTVYQEGLFREDSNTRTTFLKLTKCELCISIYLLILNMCNLLLISDLFTTIGKTSIQTKIYLQIMLCALNCVYLLFHIYWNL